MRYQDEKKESNLKAMAIGLLLILAIFAITILRPGSKEAKNIKTEPNSQKQSIDPAKVTKLSPEELSGMIQGKQDIKIIDIRSAAAFLSEHIPHSQNLPAENVSGAMETLNKNKKYVIVDDTANTETIGQISAIFAQSGYRELYYLDGGFSDWKSNYFSTISKGDPESFIDQSKVNYISSDELKELIAQDKDKRLYILDVRKSMQFSAGHLRDAHNIFLDDLEKRVNEIPLNKRIILCDGDSFSAFMAAVRLFDLGIADALTLSDGLITWEKKGYEIVK